MKTSDKLDIIKIAGNNRREDRAWVIVPKGGSVDDAIGKVEYEKVPGQWYYIGYCYVGSELIWEDCMEVAHGYKNRIMDLWLRQVEEETRLTLDEIISKHAPASTAGAPTNTQ